jgi:hypothetical protein
MLEGRKSSASGLTYNSVPANERILPQWCIYGKDWRKRAYFIAARLKTVAARSSADLRMGVGACKIFAFIFLAYLMAPAVIVPTTPTSALTNPMEIGTIATSTHTSVVP